MKVLLTSWSGALFGLAQIVVGQQLPIIDLGYELHQALSYNATSDIYLFSNVRYAQAPVGELRFTPPQPPLVNRTVTNGTGVRACPQGIPTWQARALGPLQQFAGGKPFTIAAWEAALANATLPIIDYNAATTEDCLFLDVYVPGSVLNQAAGCTTPAKGAPVLVWIHGGGFVFGSKAGALSPGLYNPSGLLQQAQAQGTPMIFVGINYRLGAFGFLSGPEVGSNGTQNVGLYDQRFALNWVQQNIHLFGGSSKQVTVIGESAGAGSVMLQTTAYGGAKAPFSRAIGQSNFLVPTMMEPVGTAQSFLAALNVTTLEQARQLPSTALILANAAQIAAANWSSFVYGPVVDNTFVPAPVSQLLKYGNFDDSVTFLTGHNSFEGGLFLDPNATTDAQFTQWLDGWIVSLTPAQQNYVLEVLYPPIFDGSYGYVDQGTRGAAIYGESNLDCNALFLNEAFRGQSYAYEFAVSPGLHSQDLFYTFNDVVAPAPNPIAQSILQQALISFTLTGVPRVSGAPAFPLWTADWKGMDFQIGANSSSIISSDINGTRCSWWQSQNL